MKYSCFSVGSENSISKFTYSVSNCGALALDNSLLFPTMAIASFGEQDSGAPQVILAVLQAQSSALSDLEKQIKSKEFVILQQKKLDLTPEELNEWFPENSAEIVEYFGYVLQRRDAVKVWKDLMSEINSAACGACDPLDDRLKQFFPCAVMDQYLLDPVATTEYLNQIRPTIILALQQICTEKPEDPVERLAEWLENGADKK